MVYINKYTSCTFGLNIWAVHVSAIEYTSSLSKKIWSEAYLIEGFDSNVVHEVNDEVDDVFTERNEEVLTSSDWFMKLLYFCWCTNFLVLFVTLCVAENLISTEVTGFNPLLPNR
jgi:hypothetical protein